MIHTVKYYVGEAETCETTKNETIELLDGRPLARGRGEDIEHVAVLLTSAGDDMVALGSTGIKGQHQQLLLDSRRRWRDVGPFLGCWVADENEIGGIEEEQVVPIVGEFAAVTPFIDPSLDNKKE